MLDLLQDHVLFALLWTIAVLAGLLIGWNWRAAWPERTLARQLERITNERNALARLYTQVKYYYDLREVDLRKVSLELGNLREQVQQYEAERTLLLEAAQANTTRLERAETDAARLASEVVALEADHRRLSEENHLLRTELEALRTQTSGWQRLHADFATAQHRLQALEERNLLLEQERRQLRDQLAIARARIEQQLRELEHYAQQVRQLMESARASDAFSEPTQTRPQGDDLSRINGITPEVARRLNELGIHSFVQVSQWDDDDILNIARALDISFVRIVQENWVGQAQTLVTGMP